MKENFVNNMLNTVKDKAGQVVKTAQFIGLAGAISHSSLVSAQKEKVTTDKVIPQTEATSVKSETKNIDENVIYVEDESDPRLKAYQDSLELYNKSEEWKKNLESMGFVVVRDDAGKVEKYKKITYQRFIYRNETHPDSKFPERPLSTKIYTKTLNPNRITWDYTIGPPILNKKNTYIVDETNMPLTISYKNPSLLAMSDEELKKLGYEHTDCGNECYTEEEVPVYEKPKKEVRIKPHKDNFHTEKASLYARVLGKEFHSEDVEDANIKFQEDLGSYEDEGGNQQQITVTMLQNMGDKKAKEFLTMLQNRNPNQDKGNYWNMYQNLLAEREKFLKWNTEKKKKDNNINPNLEARN